MDQSLFNKRNTYNYISAVIFKLSHHSVVGSRAVHLAKNKMYYLIVFVSFLCLSANGQELNQMEFLSNVHVSAEFLTPLKILDADIKTCMLSNGAPVACTTLRVCVNHTGLTESLGDLSIQYLLDSGTKSVPRLFFLQPEGLYTQEQLLVLDNTNTGACIERNVFIRDDIKDKLSPIEVEVKFAVRPKNIQSPAMAKFSKDFITIRKNCGFDNICIPDLVLSLVPNVPTYLIGSYQLIELGVSIANIGEDSFETRAEIVLPFDVQFVNVKMVTSPPIICLLSDKSLLCDVGNPLPSNATVQFVALFQPIEKPGMTRNFVFDAFVSTSTPELPETLADNHKTVSINVDVSTKLRLEALALPAEVVYNSTALGEDDLDNITYVSELGPEVIHTYTIYNDGITALEVIDLRIIILNSTIEGHDLFYLTEDPIAIGGAACEPITANYKNYKQESSEPLLPPIGDIPAPPGPLPPPSTEPSATSAPVDEQTAEASTSEEPPQHEEEAQEGKSRRRRYVEIFKINTNLVEAGILSKCPKDQCVSIKCSILGLQNGKFAQVTLKSRLHVHSLAKVKVKDLSASVSTVLLAQVESVPFIGVPNDSNIFVAQAVTEAVEFVEPITENEAVESEGKSENEVEEKKEEKEEKTEEQEEKA